MILKSFSKINLTLDVISKLKKRKLHNIQSYFCLIDLYDQIHIKKIKRQKDRIKFKGKFLNKINNKNNSILDTLQILRKNNFLNNHYSIVVNKRIPVFGGMGGGTGNAACLVKYLVKKKISKKVMNTLNDKIGSDFNLFFCKQGFLQNIKTIIKLKKNFKFYFLLVYPNKKCSTKFIYSQVRKYSSLKKYNSQLINTRSKFLDYLISHNNDLQSIVETRYPIIKKLIKEIQQIKGCYFSRITGSGAVCYGIFKSKKTVKNALNLIRLKYPKYWSSIAKTI